MLAFYNPASPHSNWQRGFPSRSFLVTYRLQSRLVCKAGLSIAAATPDPSATNDINLSNDAGITLKFWCNHQKQPAVCQKAHPVTRLISQHSLPFFDHNCKCDSDDANKSILLNGIMAEMVLIRQIKPNQIDAGQ
jgi:hypothetical protein